MYHIASVSWGKDSLAMLLELMEREAPLDEVVFYDTGMEFEAIYSIRDEILPVLSSSGIKYTELKPEMPFLYKMFEKPVNGRNGFHHGYSWCGGHNTRRLFFAEKNKKIPFCLLTLYIK